MLAAQLTRLQIVDTPPGTSDEHLSLAQYLSSCGITGAIIVTTPQVIQPIICPALHLMFSQEVSLLDVRKEITFCKKVHIPIIGVVENMSGFVCPNCKVSKQAQSFSLSVSLSLSLSQSLSVSQSLSQSLSLCMYVSLSFEVSHLRVLT